MHSVVWLIPDISYISGNEYVSSLPLQMAYYFNIFYFPFWVVMIIYSYQLKVSPTTYLCFPFQLVEWYSNAFQEFCLKILPQTFHIQHHWFEMVKCCSETFIFNITYLNVIFRNIWLSVWIFGHTLQDHHNSHPGCIDFDGYWTTVCWICWKSHWAGQLNMSQNRFIDWWFP